MAHPETSPASPATDQPRPDFAAIAERARQLTDAGQANDAIALCRAALPDQTAQARLWRAAAAAHLQQDQIPQAIDALRAAIACLPGDLEAHGTLANLYAKTGEHAKAVEAIEFIAGAIRNIDGILPELGRQALLAGRGNRDSHTFSRLDVANIAHQYYAQNRLLAVVAVCGMVDSSQDAVDPASGLIDALAALANFRLGREEAAAARLRRLVSRSAGLSPYDILYRVTTWCKDWPAAQRGDLLREYARAAAAMASWRHLQEIAGLLDEPDAADACLKAALAVAPAEPALLMARARQLNRSGRLDPAIDTYKRLIFIDPAHWLAHYDLVRLLRLAGRHGESDDYERRQQSLPRPDGDNAGFHELGQSGMIDMSDVAAQSAKSDVVKKYWRRTGDIRFFPQSFDQGDTATLIQRHFLDEGRALPAPIFAKTAQLVTFGSCFATYLRRFLAMNGRTSETIQIAEELNNTWALRYYLDWCFTGDQKSVSYWYETAENLYAPPRPHDEYRALFEKADGFVFTLGLSEIWRDRETGGVFWKGIPESVFEEDRHEIILSSVEDNFENILYIVELIRRHCGDKPIIFTVSPVPLKATFRGVPCIEADCASKSVLRVAVEYLMMRKMPNVYYWPSYEIIRWMGGHQNSSPYGDGSPLKNGARHVNHDVVNAIVSTFIRSYFAG